MYFLFVCLLYVDMEVRDSFSITGLYRIFIGRLQWTTGMEKFDGSKHFKNFIVKCLPHNFIGFSKKIVSEFSLKFVLVSCF